MRKAVLFDLDGTLVDTIPDIAAVMNAVLEELGFPPHPQKEYLAFVGWGSRELSRLSLPESARTEENIRAADRGMKTLYAKNPVARSRPYPGIKDALGALNRHGIGLAVLSNKPDELTQAVIEKLFPDIPFAVVRGGRDGVPNKPDPTSALAIARELSVDPQDCFFVGDSDVDMRTAVNARMIPTAVSWGYRGVDELKAAGAARVLMRPEELLGLMD